MIKITIVLLASVALAAAADQFGQPQAIGGVGSGTGTPGRDEFGQPLVIPDFGSGPGTPGFDEFGQPLVIRGSGSGPGTPGFDEFGQPLINDSGSRNKRDCPSICPAIFAPVCGFDGKCYKNFSNGCELASAACSGRGNFRQVTESECNKPGARTCQ